ncbi:unnamed protein product [Calypogeia fissa]
MGFRDGDIGDWRTFGESEQEWRKPAAIFRGDLEAVWLGLLESCWEQFIVLFHHLAAAVDPQLLGTVKTRMERHLHYTVLDWDGTEL